MAATRLNPPHVPSLPWVNGWYYGTFIGGWCFLVPLPSQRTVSSATVSGAQVWTPARGWQSISYTGLAYVGGTACLMFDVSSTDAETGKSYLVNMAVSLS